MLQEQVNNAIARVEAPPRDLSPTPAINHLLLLLREILSTTSMNEGREKIWNKVTIFPFQYFLIKIFYNSFLFLDNSYSTRSLVENSL